LPPQEPHYPALAVSLNKMTTQTFKSPSGPFQVHFYQNLKTGALHYADDFKAVFNHNGSWQ